MKRPSIVILVFLLALGGIAASTVWAYWDTDQISERENRKLSQAPVLSKESWLSGDFARDTEAFLADHAYDRDRLLAVSEDLEAGLEKEMEVKVVTQAVDMGQQEPDKEEDGAPGGELSDTAQEEAEEEERILLEDRVLASYAASERARNNYRNVVNRFFDMFPDTVTKANLIVPTRIAFEPDYQDYAGDQRSDIQKVYEGLPDDVYKVDIWEELSAGDVNELYFRTDHHWTMDGSYIGVKAYLEAVGRSCVPKEEYERTEGKPFLGYLYAQTGQKSLNDHKDELVYYVHPQGIAREVLYIHDEDEEELTAREDAVIDPHRQGYYTFVGRSFSHAVIEGKAGDQSCVLLVGDSYCNVMTPWLSDNFGKVVIIDPRDWTSGKSGLMKLVKEEGVTDVLVADYASVITNYWFAGQIENMTE